MCDASESRNSLSDQTFEMCELEILARRKSGSEKIEANRLDLISSTPAGKTKTTSNESTWHFVSRLVRGRGRRRRKIITCPSNKQTVLLSLSAVVLVVSSMSMLMPVVRAVPVPKIRDRNSLTSAMVRPKNLSTLVRDNCPYLSTCPFFADVPYEVRVYGRHGPPSWRAEC